MPPIGCRQGDGDPSAAWLKAWGPEVERCAQQSSAQTSVHCHCLPHDELL